MLFWIIKKRKMLKEKQLDICNKILNYIQENQKEVSLDTLNKYLRHEGYNQGEIKSAISFLEAHYQFIESYTGSLFDRQYICYRLTPEGNEAIKIGLKKRIRNKNRNYNKTAVTISILALCLSAIDPALKLKETIFPTGESGKVSNEVYYKQDQTDSISSQLLSDSVFMEKTKYIIQHDTAFLNGLKVELRKTN